MGEIKTRHLTGDRRFVMKTTLNLGSLSFNFGDSSDRYISNQGCSPMPENKTTATLDIKDITVTFEASVEETLADIQMTLDCVKELKNLGSEIANLFAELQNKKEVRMEQESYEKTSLRADFNERFNALSEKIDNDKKDLESKFNNFSPKIADR